MQIGKLSGIGYTPNFSSNKVLCDTKFLQLKTTPSPDGTFDWTYAHRPNAKDVVVIAPIIKDEKEGDKIIFLKTNRPPITGEGKAKGCIELPAGLVGDENKNESVQEAIKKEVCEETGYQTDKVTIANNMVASSPGCVSETSAIAVANITNKEKISKPVTDNGVIEEMVEVPVKDVDNWINKQTKMGYIITAQALSGLYYATSNNNA